MLLTITTTHQPATDLGFLLHKHPDKLQSFPLPFGQAHVFYPEASVERCTAALLLEIDPVALTRRAPGERGFALEPYVNDRPYVASSFLSVAMARVFGSALGGRVGGGRGLEALAETALPLTLTLSSLPCRGGEKLQERLFAPLGYRVEAARHPLDEAFPAWGESPYMDVTLKATLPLAQALRHLYVLIPVLDDEKHYWVGDDEVQKLLDKGEGWLPDHPEKPLIARRYLKHQRSLAEAALGRLAPGGEGEDGALEAGTEIEAEVTPGLHEQRLARVHELLKASGATRVLDLGCGEGKLLGRLLGDAHFTEVVGVDVSPKALERASARLERLPERVRARARLLHGSLLYRDSRLSGFDAAALVEVVEHLEPFRLGAFERTVFGFARPKTVVLTTPNAEYNVVWPSLPAGGLRHRDHRFEWTRKELEGWASRVAQTYGYTVHIGGVGPEEGAVGAPSQVAVFERVEVETKVRAEVQAEVTS